MQDAIAKVSIQQQQNATRIAKKELAKWVGQPIALWVRRVVRTNDRYKVTGTVGPKGLDVRQHTGAGSPFTLIFRMPPDGDSYGLELLVVDKGSVEIGL